MGRICRKQRRKSSEDLKDVRDGDLSAEGRRNKSEGKSSHTEVEDVAVCSLPFYSLCSHSSTCPLAPLETAETITIKVMWRSWLAEMSAANFSALSSLTDIIRIKTLTWTWTASTQNISPCSVSAIRQSWPLCTQSKLLQLDVSASTTEEEGALFETVAATEQISIFFYLEEEPCFFPSPNRPRPISSTAPYVLFMWFVEAHAASDWQLVHTTNHLPSNVFYTCLPFLKCFLSVILTCSR